LVWFIIFTKNGRKPFDSRFRTMKVKVVLDDMAVRKNGVKSQVVQRVCFNTFQNKILEKTFMN
jgi:hypothetical protein